MKISKPNHDMAGGGGTEYFTIWLTALGADANNVPNFSGTTSSSPTRTWSSPTGTGTRAGPSSGSSQPTSPGQLEAGSGIHGKGSGNQHSDEDVAIAVGVVIGVVALALMGFIFWWTARRRKRTGTFNRFGSVDGSTAVFQSEKSQPAPNTIEPEMTAMPTLGPAIRIQQPTVRF